MSTPCLHVAASKGPYASLDTAAFATPSYCSDGMRIRAPCLNRALGLSPKSAPSRLTSVHRPSGEAINTPRRSYPKPQTPAAPYDTSKVMLLHVLPKIPKDSLLVTPGFQAVLVVAPAWLCSAPAAAAQKQKGSGLLSAPARQRCCARCPKPFTIFIATLVLALVLISGLMIGHFAVPYIRNMVSP